MACWPGWRGGPGRRMNFIKHFRIFVVNLSRKKLHRWSIFMSSLHMRQQRNNFLSRLKLRLCCNPIIENAPNFDQWLNSVWIKRISVFERNLTLCVHFNSSKLLSFIRCQIEKISSFFSSYVLEEARKFAAFWLFPIFEWHVIEHLSIYRWRKRLRIASKEFILAGSSLIRHPSRKKLLRKKSGLLFD